MPDPSTSSGSPRAESRGDWTEHLRARLALLRLSPAREAEIIEELSQHLDQRYEELRGGGTSDADARRLAIEELLDRDTLANHMRSLRQAHVPPPVTPGVPNRFLLGDFWQDLRYTARMVRKQPGFAAAAVMTLALGIGANTAIFSVVNSVLINPLPYPDPDQLVNVVHLVNGADLAYFSDRVYLTYAENNQTFQEFGVWAAGTATVTGGGEPEQVRTLVVSSEVLRAFGMRPHLGRWFSSEDGAPGMPGTVMLTDAFWQRRFGGDRDVLERALTINARQHQIIGVMPAAFRFSGEPDIILPQRIVPPGLSAFNHQGVARLKRGVTLAQANADVARMIPMWFKDTRANASRFTPSLRPLKQDVVGDVGKTLWILMGTIGLVLLMACGNVANLLLVRAEARRQEFAIRAALGARWTRVARQLLVESLTLALLGGALGVGLAYGGLRLLVAIGPSNLPRLSEISIDTVVLGFAVAVSLLSGLLFGLIPILRYAGPRLVTVIGGGGRGASLTRERQRSQNALVAAQVALALVLLVSSGLMIRSFQALRSVDPGFRQPGSVQTFSLFIPATETGDPNLEGGASMRPDDQLARTQQAVLEKLAAIPGVASAAFTSYLPMDADTSTRASDAVDGETAPNPTTHVSRQIRFVSPGLFQTLGIRLIAGEDFTWTDVHDKRDVAIVSENFARELWGSPAAALGKRIRQGAGPWSVIVGVTNDISDNGVDQPRPAMVFLPARLHRIFGLPGYLARQVTVTIRSERAGTERFLEQVREAVWSVNATLPLAKVRTLGDVYDRSMARTSFTLVMLAIAGAMALLLGICGIYGVIAYAVSQRRREIGIRLALGAQAREIRGLFVRRGLVLAGIGVAIGLGSAAGFTRLMRSLLFGISPLDPITFTAMPVVLTAAAMLASYLPARRAMAVDPVETMRAE
jgi:predicted permease